MDKSNFLPPMVSISVVNLNGKDYLSTCLDSIKNLNYPQDKLEIIVVDNGSTDGSVKLVKENYPEVKIIKNGKNMGFAFANNQAARIASGEYVAFLNNDTKVDKEWLIELLKPVYGDSEVVASGSKVLSADGKRLDFVGSMINFEGKGFQVDYGAPTDKDIYNQYKNLLFVNGGAMLVDRQVFLDTGGFDEDFFAYYEDVDFGWRLWVLGYKVVFAPKSIVYHVHHGTSKAFSEDKLRFLKERNSLYSVFKNYDDENLPKAFSASLANFFNRIFVDFKFDYKKYYDFSIGSSNLAEELTKKIGEEANNLNISKEPLSSLAAVKDFFENLPKLREKREKIQRSRKRDDKAIFTYFKGEFLAVSPDKDYQKNQIEILKSLGVYELFQKEIRRTLLIISSEVVSKEMAGPAIRVWNIAKTLSEHMNVVLAVPNKVELPEQVFKIVQYRSDSELRHIIEGVDIVLSGGTSFSKCRSIRQSGKYLIIDMYDPCNLAILAEYQDESIEKRMKVYRSMYSSLNDRLYNGDFFVCASDRQRDFWLGMLAALNRVNPYSYDQDPTLKKMIDIVPFGIPCNKPSHNKNVLKGKIDGIREDDFVIIWGGGIYNWFDPLTLIRAMDKVSEDRDDIKLFFMGVKHPNPKVRKLQLAGETVDLAKKLNIYNKSVFFNFGWVEYENRQNYLLESDAGIITYPEHIETRFSFRTRILDYLWADLPIISTKGDSLSELVERENLGITVRSGNVDDIVKAIVRLADDKEFYRICVGNIENVAKEYTWEKVCQPLVNFCKDPAFSAVKDKSEKGSSGNREMSIADGSSKCCKKKNTAYLIRRFFHHLFHSGPRKTSEFLSNYIKRK